MTQLNFTVSITLKVNRKLSDAELPQLSLEDLEAHVVLGNTELATKIQGWTTEAVDRV
jgi:hypothetical protein